MLTVQQVFQCAVAFAKEVIGNDREFTLEEVKRDRYREQDAWSITLGLPKRKPNSDEVMRFPWPREYKTFLINAQTGQPIAMKIREFAG